VSLTWKEAHRIGMLKAAHAHLDFQINNEERVPVFEIIEAAGIILTFQTTPRLSSALISESGSRPGIMINTAHPISRQRYTASHELGHFLFGHATTIELEGDAFERWDAVSMPEDEKIAEAFASWFLMPRPLVRRSLGRLHLDRPRDETDVYALSLLMGASYRATARHLVNLRLATSTDLTMWLKTPPSRVKRKLADDFVPTSMRNDVWLLGPEQNGITISPRVGDRVIVELPEIPSSGFSWVVSEKPPALRMLAELDLPAGRSGVDGSGQDQPPGAEALHRLIFGVEGNGRSSGDLKAILTLPWASDPVEQSWFVKANVEPERKGIAEHWFAAA
jgi:Zn-dependent peptidase ImmA (M78 family)